MQPFHGGNNLIDTVFDMRAVTFFCSALATTMNKDCFAVIECNVCNIHQSTAVVAAVARVHIHMFGHQTMGAVVAIAVTQHDFAALVTHKIFLVPLEFFALEFC